MSERVVVRRGAFRDSIALMEAARGPGAMPGVAFAAAVMATPVNVDLLVDAGFHLPVDLTTDDLVVAVRAADDSVLEAALEEVDRRLQATGPRAGPGDVATAASLRSVARQHGPHDVAIISVPGRHAAYEVSSALDAGMHVFCFSSGFPTGVEARLKRRAAAAGLLLMGPDCGTAMIDGIGYGFTNAVRRGPVGLVGAAGTGMQEVMCLLDRSGIGVSQAIGVGGRDLGDTVGGVMTLQALARLDADDATEIVVVVSKPPGRSTHGPLLEAARAMRKPVVLALLGPAGDLPREGRDRGTDTVRTVHSLEHGARAAAASLGMALEEEPTPEVGPPRTGAIRGLFTGGSLCHETMGVVAAAGIPVRFDAAAPGGSPEFPDVAKGATFVDFGDESFTEGRAHPMIDPTLRNQRLERESARPDVAVAVMDLVLGRGAHPDPASELAPLIRHALDRRPELLVVVTVCGVATDPQGFDGQVEALRGAGALVVRSAASAGRVAIAAVSGSAP